jgi:hypothetical protein
VQKIYRCAQTCLVFLLLFHKSLVLRKHLLFHAKFHPVLAFYNLFLVLHQLYHAVLPVLLPVYVLHHVLFAVPAQGQLHCIPVLHLPPSSGFYQWLQS